MKKNNFKKIFVVFSLCVFLLSMFSISSFALNISDVSRGSLYKFGSSLTANESQVEKQLVVEGYLVDKNNGNMIPFTFLTYKREASVEPNYYKLSANTENGVVVVAGSGSSSYHVYIDFSTNTVSKASVENIFSKFWSYTVTDLDPVVSMFDKANTALVGGTNSEGVAYDGLLGMVSKFGKFLVSSPLLLVLCIALPLVSFSVGLFVRIKNKV